MLRRFLRKAHVSRSLQRLRVAIAVPSGLTEVERLAVLESIHNAGAADVLLVNQVLAAARGAGLAVEEPRGQMVVNVGAGVTDVAIISLGNPVYARAMSTAGDDMDAAISAHVRATRQLIIGEPTAERLKIQIGSAVSNHDELTLAVKGRCITRGVPREARIHDGEVREAISTPLGRIMAAIREALEETPPELSSDLIERGILLTGGTALLRNFDQYISRGCGLPVKVAQDPLSCVIRGLAYQLNRLRPSDWRQ
jgi:rod shape-determining protein MreB